MKVKISSVLISTQERLLGYITEMSYGYAQLCVKADPSSLLSFEERIEEKKYKMEEMARIVVHDKEGDDDKIDLYPIEPAFITLLITGMVKVHPEFHVSVETDEDAEPGDDSPQLKFVRLTMPKVTKERRDFLLSAVDMLDNRCKVRHGEMKVKYSAELTKVCIGEPPAAIDEATSTMDKLMSHYDEMRRQMTEKKKEEIENAYQRYLREKAKEDGVNRDDKGNKIGSTIKV